MSIEICSFCNTDRATHFNEDWDAMLCDECANDPVPVLRRKEITKPQAGYRYLNSRIMIIHTTSVVQNDEAALKYLLTVRSWGLAAKYVQKREPGSTSWVTLPYEFKDGEVVCLT